MDLHMVLFGGTTFGVSGIKGTTPAWRRMKKNISCRDITPNRITRKALCVDADDLAAVLDTIDGLGWHVREHWIKTVRWNDSPTYYVYYKNQKEDK